MSWLESRPRNAAAGRAETRGVLALVLASFLWGSTFLVVQDATDHASVMAFLAARFLIAAAVLWPFARLRAASPDEILHGVVAGTLFLGGYALQTSGLRYTTTSASAFITYLLVVFVPLINSALERKLPGPPMLAGVGLAVIGMGLLSGGPGQLGRGEWLTLGCALCFAVHLVYLGSTTRLHDPVRFTFWQVLTVGLGCLVPGLFTGGFAFGASAWGAAAFTGIGATAVAVMCMVWAQRVLPATRTALLLLLEPLFAALLGYAVGDRLGGRGLLGAALILAAVLVAELFPVWHGRPVRPHQADV